MSVFNEIQLNDELAEHTVSSDPVEPTTQTPYQSLMQYPTASLALDAVNHPQCADVAILGYN